MKKNFWNISSQYKFFLCLIKVDPTSNRHMIYTYKFGNRLEMLETIVKNRLIKNGDDITQYAIINCEEGVLERIPPDIYAEIDKLLAKKTSTKVNSVKN